MTTLTTPSQPRLRKSQAAPRWATRRRPERPTLGGQIGEVAKLLGTPLMPHQQLIADVGGELMPDTGLPAYREIWFTIMRQSGKTSLALPFEVHRCISPVWGSPQRVVYTAQTGWEAKTKFLEDQIPMLQASPLGRLITPAGGGRVRRAQGDWGANFGGGGGSIDVLGSSPSAGHGRTVDLGVLDEAWKDEDDRREQALLPAMVTRPAAQLLGYSTMGTEASTYLNRKVETGRAATMEDYGQGLAYFEWSIPDDADIDDPEVWWQYMPALGWTISEPAVAHARQTMTDGEFRRAFGNQRTVSAERLIPADLYDQVQDPSADPGAKPTLAIDVDRDRGTWAVAASDGESGEVIDHEGLRPTEWFAAKESRRARPVVLDNSGPAASVGDELEAMRIKVIRRSRVEVADDCGRLYDAIADGKIRIRPTSQALDDAVAGVAKKPTGDKFVWSRSTSAADVTPLMALTLAYGPREQAAAPRIRTIGA